MASVARTLLAVTVISAATAQSVTAQSSSQSVHLRNDARVDDDTFEAARQLASEIYAKAGLDLIWADDEAALTIVLRPRASKQTASRAQDAMGYTPGGGTERGRLAFVIVNRVHEVSDGYRAPRSVVLGCRHCARARSPADLERTLDNRHYEAVLQSGRFPQCKKRTFAFHGPAGPAPRCSRHRWNRTRGNGAASQPDGRNWPGSTDNRAACG